MIDFGRVLEHYDAALEKTLSHKSDRAVLQMQHDDGSRLILRIYSREIPAYRALTGHDCQCLPQIFRTCMQEGFFVVEEEFMDGVSLQEMISGGARMDESRTCHITRKISSAAAFLHASGFIHRDIKPEHVLLTADGRIVLMDLDASMRIAPEKSGDTQLLGTAMYAAPEQFGLSRSDERTDIYAIGILMNELLTGVHPAVIRYRGGKLAEIISRCTQMNPTDRYQSVEELIAVLDEIAEKKAVPLKKTPGWKQAVAVAALACAVGLAAWILADGSVLSDGSVLADDSVLPDGSALPDGSVLPDDSVLADGSVLPDDSVLPDGSADDQAEHPEQLEEAGTQGLNEDDSKTQPESEANPGETKTSGGDASAGEKTSGGKTSNGNASAAGNSSNGNASAAGNSSSSGNAAGSGDFAQGSAESGNAAKVAGTDYLQLYKEGQRLTVYHNYRSGNQSAPLFTEDGIRVDETWNVYADKAVGQIDGWDSYYRGWRLNSEGCQMGASGYIHAEKDGKHYAILVMVMGEPMSAYSKLPSRANYTDGYIQPSVYPEIAGGRIIQLTYEPGKPKKIYLVAMEGFRNLQPVCSSSLVTITPCQDALAWYEPVFTMTFDNPAGGDALIEVSSNHNSLMFYFTE